MLTTIYICICKLITLACHILGKDGSVFPGSIAYKHNKKILWNLKYPEKVIIVTGSSGKSSTTSLIAHILKNANKNVIWNDKESNIGNAIVTTVLNNTSIFTHKVKGDVLLLEIDERHIKNLFKAGTISHIVITNITRDQPIRNIHPDVIYNIITDSLDDDMHVIINADDPMLNRIKYIHKGPITTYGVDKTKYSQTTTPGYAIDAAYCPLCHTKLKYNIYHYGHFGIYNCPNCEFGRGKIDYLGTDVDLDKCKLKINDKNYTLNKNAFFAIYYTLAAYAVSCTIGISEKDIAYALNKNISKPKRMNTTFEMDNRPVTLLEPKNENALSYLQSLNYITLKKGLKSLIIGFDKVSRRYPYKDISWLWDINFELLAKNDIDKVFCIGNFRYELATRLYYANVDESKIVLIDNLDILLDKIKKESTGEIYVMVGDDMKARISSLLKEVQHEKTNN